MKHASIFWFTGLSGSGKSSVAEGVKVKLASLGYAVRIIDGDEVRATFNRHLGFSERDIETNNCLIADLGASCRGNFDVILVPIISPLIRLRSMARKRLAEPFYEVYFNADLACVSARDVKGLYAKASRNEIINLIGYSDANPYEVPINPDFVVESGQQTLDVSIDGFLRFISIISKVSRRKHDEHP